MNKIHEQAMQHFKASTDFYTPIRREASEDLKFVAGQQWQEDPLNDGRQKLTIPLIASFLRHITNEARKNSPNILVSPCGGMATSDKAKFLQGLIRHIELKSDAKTAYSNAFWYAAASGEGYIILDRDYTSETSFDQELIIKSVADPSRILLDPYCECIDGEDANWGFIIEDVNKEYFKAQFPEAKMTERLNSNFKTDLIADWEDSNTIRIARYFVREAKQSTLYLYKSSDPLREPFVSSAGPDEVQGMPGETFTVLAKRPVSTYTVKEYLINGIEVLSETEWPCTSIPIRKVIGDHYYVDGKLVQHGAVRLTKDPQKLYNWTSSIAAEMIDMAPKSSFVAAAGQIANNPEDWANANTTNYGVLTYEPQSLDGAMVPPPQRVQAMDAGTFQSVMSNRMASLEDLKLIFGVQDASLGRPGNEISGVAILARQEQSGHSNYHYFDNLCTTIRSLGRLIMELIPAIYDGERIVNIVKDDESVSQVTINNGGSYDLSMDEKYEVTISTGPSYGTQRQEAVESMTALIQAYPNAGPLMSDILVGAMDWPEAQRVAKRLKAAVPPEIRAATGEDMEGEAAPAEMLQQVQMQLAEVTTKLEQNELELKEAKMKLSIAENKAALELTKMDQENEVRAAEAQNERLKIELENKKVELERELKLIQLQLHERELVVKEKMLEMKAAGMLLDDSMPSVNLPTSHNLGS